MNYAAIRPQLRSGDLLLCSGTSWFSRLIQLATGSEWSHVGLVLRLERLDRVMLLESVESVGVRAVPLSRYFENYQQTGQAYPGKLDFYRHREFPEVADAAPALKQMGRFAVDRLGWPYDGQQIAELAARLMWHHLGAGRGEDHPTTADCQDGDPVVRPLLSEHLRQTQCGPEGSGAFAGSLTNRAYICSEYVAACYAELGLEISCRACPYVTPGDFVADAKVERIVLARFAEQGGSS